MSHWCKRWCLHQCKRHRDGQNCRLLPAPSGDDRGVRSKSARSFLRPLPLERLSLISPVGLTFVPDRSIGSGKSCVLALWRWKSGPSANSRSRARLDTLEPPRLRSCSRQRETKDRLHEIIEGFFFRRRTSDRKRPGNNGFSTLTGSSITPSLSAGRPSRRPRASTGTGLSHVIDRPGHWTKEKGPERSGPFFYLGHHGPISRSSGASKSQRPLIHIW